MRSKWSDVRTASGLKKLDAQYTLSMILTDQKKRIIAVLERGKKNEQIH